MGCFFTKIKHINSNTEINNEQKNNNLPIELDELLQQNKIETQKKFYNVLNREISETDGIGFIYGFTKDNDDKWIKIGRTMQPNPNKRVDQWKGDILFCQKTKNNKKIEILIHLLLKNRNIYRINLKTGAKEIEWFYFDNFVNVPKILAILIEYVDNYSIITTPSHVG